MKRTLKPGWIRLAWATTALLLVTATSVPFLQHFHDACTAYNQAQSERRREIISLRINLAELKVNLNQQNSKIADLRHFLDQEDERKGREGRLAELSTQLDRLRTVHHGLQRALLNPDNQQSLLSEMGLQSGEDLAPWLQDAIFTSELESPSVLPNSESGLLAFSLRLESEIMKQEAQLLHLSPGSQLATPQLAQISAARPLAPAQGSNDVTDVSALNQLNAMRSARADTMASLNHARARLKMLARSWTEPPAHCRTPLVKLLTR